MKEILEMFVYKPRKTEKIIIAFLKLLFSLCFTVWFYEYIGIKDIVEQITELDKLKTFIIKGNLLLFLFIYFIVYQTFFNISSYLFSFIGFVSYWIARFIYFLCFSVILDLIFSLIAWPFIKKFKFTLRYNSNIDDGFFAFSYKIFKRLLVRAKLMNSKEQRIRSSKELDNFAKQVKTIMIKDSETLYKNIHLMFIFTILFYVYYFYYLKYSSIQHPVLDFIVFWVCILSVSFQLVGYWLYSNFRIIYYAYLLFYRGIHKQDVLEREMNLFMNQLAEELTLSLSEEVNDASEASENQ